MIRTALEQNLKIVGAGVVFRGSKETECSAEKDLVLVPLAEASPYNTCRRVPKVIMKFVAPGDPVQPPVNRLAKIQTSCIFQRKES
jgi:hypothetical protein